KNKRELGVWSFYPLLPTNSIGLTSGEGWTPLLKAENLSKYLKIRGLYIKNESTNPTGTFIDRGISVDLWYAKESGYSKVLAAALGDYAVSLSSYAAKLDINSVIYVPQDIERSKLYRAILNGSRVLTMDSYSKALDKVLKFINSTNFYVSIPASPTIIDGYRTIVFELFELVRNIDTVIVPVGDGVLATALFKGFMELSQFLEFNIPRIIAVQLLAKPTLMKALYGIADSKQYRKELLNFLREVLVDKPLAMNTVLRAIKDSNGMAVAVSEDEVLRSVLILSKYEGLTPDPVGAIGIAGLMKMIDNGVIDRDEKVLVIITGSSSRDPFILYKILHRDETMLNVLRKLKQEDIMLNKPKLEILRIIAIHKVIHIYGIWKKLQEQGMAMALSTVHHHVKSLEDMGLISMIGKDGKRNLYVITEQGLEVLKAFEG
ncbi:MAG TPA: pyridoxal-phosphate dependent enzyme, partial [Ignisphaera sp.]|nr:pyridoxal-phosphate dependent enzyme [Ignisphaera sp.]